MSRPNGTCAVVGGPHRVGRAQEIGWVGKQTPLENALPRGLRLSLRACPGTPSRAAHVADRCEKEGGEKGTDRRRWRLEDSPMTANVVWRALRGASRIDRACDEFAEIEGRNRRD